MSYKEMMAKNYWFKHYGIMPLWDPEDSNIHFFIHDEVVRQGHNTKIPDGMEREKGMLLAWKYAIETQAIYLIPTVDDIIRIGKYIEPEYNRADGFRLHNVYIGDDTGAPPGLIDMMMIRLVAHVQAVDPDLGKSMDEPSHIDFRLLWRYMRDDEKHEILMDRFGSLVDQINSPDAWYLAFEAIHPFADGNGRTGKILHNWLSGTLLKPILIQDYFGGGNP